MGQHKMQIMTINKRNQSSVNFLCFLKSVLHVKTRNHREAILYSRGSLITVQRRLLLHGGVSVFLENLGGLFCIVEAHGVRGFPTSYATSNMLKYLQTFQIWFIIKNNCKGVQCEKQNIINVVKNMPSSSPPPPEKKITRNDHTFYI